MGVVVDAVSIGIHLKVLFATYNLPEIKFRPQQDLQLKLQQLFLTFIPHRGFICDFNSYTFIQVVSIVEMFFMDAAAVVHVVVVISFAIIIVVAFADVVEVVAAVAIVVASPYYCCCCCYFCCQHLLLLLCFMK